MNRLQMRAGHRKNVRGALDQLIRQRLTAKAADVHVFFLADLHRVKTGRLSTHRVNAGGDDLDIPAIANESAEQPFRNWASTNVSCANKEDAFHGRSQP